MVFLTKLELHFRELKHLMQNLWMLAWRPSNTNQFFNLLIILAANKRFLNLQVMKTG